MANKLKDARMKLHTFEVMIFLSRATIAQAQREHEMEDCILPLVVRPQTLNLCYIQQFKPQ